MFHYALPLRQTVNSLMNLGGGRQVDREQQEDLDPPLDVTAHSWDRQAPPPPTPPVVLPSSARRAVSLPVEAAELSGAAAGDLDRRLNPGCVNR